MTAIPKGEEMRRPTRAPGLRAVLLATLLVLALGVPALGSTDEPDSALGPAPGKYTILSGGSEVEIPFEMFRGDIRMKGGIEGRPARLMLDNGYMWDDLLIFGSETRGLPAKLLERHADRVLTIPMLTGRVRSLNLANAVAIVLYEALRQLNERGIVDG